MDCRADHAGLARAGSALHDHERIGRGNRGGSLNPLRIEAHIARQTRHSRDTIGVICADIARASREHVAQSCLDRDDMQ